MLFVNLFWAIQYRDQWSRYWIAQSLTCNEAAERVPAQRVDCRDGGFSSVSAVRKKAFAVAILTTVLAVPFVSRGQTQSSGTEIPYEKFVLENGLTVLVHEDHETPVVAVNVWYHVGSKNEKLGKTGFAQLFEHLMFGGSEHARGRYFDTMEGVGATDLNGTTDPDRTNYFQTVPTSALDFTLWMESDRMGHMLGALDQKTLDLQRGVVENEKRERENQPYGLTRQLIAENTYPMGHPYSWTVQGEMADLEGASLQDVRDWFKTYYGPSNAVLVLAGDIDVKTAKDKVEKYFGDIPAGPPVHRETLWVAKMSGMHREIVQDRVPQARIYLVWNIPAYGSAEGDYLDLVGDCLSTGKSSRLYKRLVYDDQIATDVDDLVTFREMGGQFRLQATVRQGQQVGQVETELNDELARFLRDGPTEEELQRVKTQHAADFIRGIEKVGGLGGKSDVLAQGEVFMGNADAYKMRLKHVEDATPEDLRQAASRWLADGRYVLTVLPFPEYKAAAVGADRSSAPGRDAPVELKLPKLQRTTLSNGLKVILAERHAIPLVSLRLTVDAGFSADQFALPGTASLTTSLLDGGTKTRTAIQISNQLALLGAELQANSNLDMSIVQLSVLKSKLDPALELFTDVLLNPSFPDEDFKRQQKAQLVAIEREQTTPEPMALRVFPRLLYGVGHAYGNPLTGTGTTESVTKITREDLMKFHQVWFRPNNATLIIVGDTTINEMKPKLEKLFAGWNPGSIPKKNIGSVERPGKSVIYLLDKPGASQSVIAAGIIAPPQSNPKEIAIEVMNDILAGLNRTFSTSLGLATGFTVRVLALRFRWRTRAAA
jgi:zinc protease